MRLLLTFLSAFFVAGAVRAQDSIRLANDAGAAATFERGEEGWAWVSLAIPGGGEAPIAVSDHSVEIANDGAAELLSPAWGLVESDGARVVFEQAVPELGFRVRRVVTFGAARNALRIETWVRSPRGPQTVARIGILDTSFAGESFRETGRAPASFPLFGEALFAGLEHVSGEAHAGDDTARLSHRPRASVGEDWQHIVTAVVGWALPGADAGLPDGSRVRVAFLQYLDTVRVKPAGIVLHSETWWTLPPPLREKDVLDDIEALRRGFQERTGMFFDTYTLDLGWSDPKTFWRIAEARFPRGFHAVNERLNQLGTKLGLWMSPGSGYPDGLNNAWLQAQGYEMMPFEGLDVAPCFALGGRYQREFRERLLGYAREYGLGHVILDFMPQRCDVATHGHPVGEESQYAIDAGVADVLDGLRAINPNIALEPMVCGYPPSPWWLMKTPFILGPAGDDVPHGRVPSPEWMESLISGRDVAYRAGQDAWIMPTQALETWDVIVQTPGDFENTAVMAIGRGRWFLSTYFKSSLMQPEDWDFFAALVRWARANQPFLANAWQFGGRAEDREAYGFMFRNPGKDLFCVRNPWIEERTIALPASVAAEARELRMIYPRRASLGRIEPGQVVTLDVAPYETAFFETLPLTADVPEPAAPVRVKAGLVAGAPVLSPAVKVSGIAEPFGMRFAWSGVIDVPAVEGAELCLLVEGETAVGHATAAALIDGREVKVRRSASVGQFSAARDAPVENWTWLIVPLTPGQRRFDVDVRIPSQQAVIGAYLRGKLEAHSEPASGDGPAFPVYQEHRRAWSQTLLPGAMYDIEQP